MVGDKGKKRAADGGDADGSGGMGGVGKSDGSGGGKMPKRADDKRLFVESNESLFRLNIKRNLYWDVKVRVGIDDDVQEFEAHRCVLAAQSGYFSMFFAGSFAGAMGGVVEIKDLDPVVFDRALDFMYTGLAVVYASELLGLLSMASRFDISCMVGPVTDKLLYIMDKQNCVSILSSAELYENGKLLRCGELIVRESFETLGGGRGLPAVTMLAMLQSERLNVCSEQLVFITLSKWLNNLADPLDEEERIKMYALVRFPLLSVDFLSSIAVTQEPSFSIGWLAGKNRKLFFGGNKAHKRRMRMHRERLNGSNILSGEDNRQILKWLDMGPDTILEKIYTGTTDGLNAYFFHSRCNAKGATVTVIRCTKGFVFGGYSSVSWSSDGMRHKSPGAFIFSLDRPGSLEPVKMRLKKKNDENAIESYWQVGPVFGHDIHLNQWFGKDFPCSAKRITTFQVPADEPGLMLTDDRFFVDEIETFRLTVVEQ